MSYQTDLDSTYNRLREFVKNNRRGYDWRMQQLNALKNLITENNDAINEALWKDMHKGTFESEASEQGVVLSEINTAMDKLVDWMASESVSTPLYNQPGSTKIVQEPYGLTLIIGAWNYPINLLLAPLSAAIAGGNAAILKPSEISAHTSALMAKLIPQYMDQSAFAVCEGGVEETGMVLDKVYDLIFFTGSSPVGKIILAKAAPHLTPVVLELGGKSPAVILKDTDLEVTARRIAWGKFLNAGQTCIAPDYVLIEKEVKEEFIAKMIEQLHKFYGDDVAHANDYCRIINKKNFQRLTALMDGTKIRHGGQSNEADLFITPTLLEATPDAKIMQEEIFGPLLPILEIENVNAAISFINARPKPLALYLFTKSDEAVEKMALETSSGALSVNDNVIHMPMPSAPFGGVGASGMGNYHGIYGFRTFTHAKTVLRKTFHPDIPIRYPPYTTRNGKILGWLME